MSRQSEFQRLEGRATRLAHGQGDPETLQLIDEIQILLKKSPPPSAECLKMIKLMLQANNAPESQRTEAWPVERRAPPEPTAAEAAHSPRKADVNCLRADKIRQCQQQRERMEWSMGSRLSAPHPPFAGSEQAPLSLTGYAERVAKARNSLRDSEPSDSHDFRFDAASNRKPTPNFANRKPPNFMLQRR
mmetsp:Transcript_55863/g.121643  ORF Transcript_55863/g.121643 Transcript_55863/m.121643 type:complete len:189 (-) Transcript_55863:333-899(-)